MTDLRLYTVSELLADVLKTEGVKLDIEDSTLYFTKLYSDLFRQAPKRNKRQTVLERVESIVTNRFQTLLCAFDHKPDPRDNYTVYGSDIIQPMLIEGGKLIYRGGFDDEETALDLVLDPFRQDYLYHLLVDHVAGICTAYSLNNLH